LSSARDGTHVDNGDNDGDDDSDGDVDGDDAAADDDDDDNYDDSNLNTRPTVRLSGDTPPHSDAENAVAQPPPISTTPHGATPSSRRLVARFWAGTRDNSRATTATSSIFFRFEKTNA